MRGALNVKASLVRTRLAYLTQRFGSEAPERLLSVLAPEDRKACERALPASWVPFALIVRIDAAILALFHGGRSEGAVELGAFSARRNLTTLYSLFVQQAQRDPQRLLESLAQLHGAFYDWGWSRASCVASGVARMEADYQGAATRINCGTALGFYSEALRVIDVPGVQACEMACQVDGAPHCVIELRWLTSAP